MKGPQGTVASVLAGALGMLALLAVAALVTVYTGSYNVAATEEHASLTRWAFDTTFHRSVRHRAAGIAVPADLAGLAAAGAGRYKRMCEHCHGGPGAKRAAWATGMRPRPPSLQKAAAEWEANEVFWLVKHGAKMTGMPAFGPAHDERALWEIAAAVKALPAMTPEEYAATPGHHAPQ